MIGDSSFIPLFEGSKTATSKSAGAKKLGGSPAARKRLIGEG
ncbi:MULTISPECIES: hypothetical protein [Bacillus cereus group]|uniref:Spermidine/putrescine ABC transporter ATP-binding protein n=1 Tax=Bacillus mycoides TaxID=1405 RepID=A0A653Q746_BACMY|nr:MULTISPECIES: hypothetical protein [Bacillus cereus group]VXB38340.1 conserved hypothetical protein [Bacillus mycoides]